MVVLMVVGGDGSDGIDIRFHSRDDDSGKDTVSDIRNGIQLEGNVLQEISRHKIHSNRCISLFPRPPVPPPSQSYNS